MADETSKSPADTAQDEARSLGDEIKNEGRKAADTARETAREYADRARAEAEARGEAYRDYAADETSKVASALRRASADLQDGSPQERFIGQIADAVADSADRVRGMTLQDMSRDVGTFARRHPAAFLGGAALIGFAAARFLKASSNDDRDDEGNYALPASPPPSGHAGAAAPVPAGAEPVPSPATRPAGATTATSPAGRPTGAATAPTPSKTTNPA